MNEVILIGLFFLIVICMGYLFDRAAIKQEEREEDE